MLEIKYIQEVKLYLSEFLLILKVKIFKYQTVPEAICRENIHKLYFKNLFFIGIYFNI